MTDIELLRKQCNELYQSAMNNGQDLLLKEHEIARLRAALLAVPCPGGGYTGIPANTEPTVAACLAAGACGCNYGNALK